MAGPQDIQQSAVPLPISDFPHLRPYFLRGGSFKPGCRLEFSHNCYGQLRNNTGQHGDGPQTDKITQTAISILVLHSCSNIFITLPRQPQQILRNQLLKRVQPEFPPKRSLLPPNDAAHQQLLRLYDLVDPEDHCNWDSYYQHPTFGMGCEDNGRDLCWSALLLD